MGSWFIVDLLGAVPFDYIVYALSQHYYTALHATKVLRMLKLLRLLRMLRLSRLYRYLGRYEEYFSGTTIKIVKLASALVLWAHFDACLYFLVPRLAAGDDFTFLPQSWIVLENLEHAEPSVQYLFSLWVAVSHMLSVSYGPFNPVRTEEVAMTLCSMVCGAALYASIIGTTASIIASSDPAGAEYQKRWEELKVFMKYKNMPVELRDRLRKYFHKRWQGHKVFDEDGITASLPEPYRRSVFMHECKWLLHTVPLLAAQSAAHNDGFIMALVPKMSSRMILSGETIMEQEEPPSKWWILGKGRVGLSRDHKRFATLREGDYFGDIALLWGVRNPFSIKCESACTFFVIERSDFEELLRAYPGVVRDMKKQAYKRCRKWRLAGVLRNEAGRGEHANAFTGIPFDFDAAEAELLAEAQASGEQLDPPDEALMREAMPPGPGDADSDDDWDYDNPLAVINHRLRKRIDRAGEAFRRFPQVLVQGSDGMLHWASGFGLGSSGIGAPHSQHFGGRDGAAGGVARPGMRARTGSSTSIDGAASRAAVLERLRAFGTTMETALRDPRTTAAALAARAREDALRVRMQMRDGMRSVRDVMTNLPAHLPVPATTFMSAPGMRRGSARSGLSAPQEASARHRSGGSVDAGWGPGPVRHDDVDLGGGRGVAPRAHGHPASPQSRRHFRPGDGRDGGVEMAAMAARTHGTMAAVAGANDGWGVSFNEAGSDAAEHLGAGASPGWNVHNEQQSYEQRHVHHRMMPQQLEAIPDDEPEHEPQGQGQLADGGDMPQPEDGSARPGGGAWRPPRRLHDHDDDVWR